MLELQKNLKLLSSHFITIGIQIGVKTNLDLTYQAGIQHEDTKNIFFKHLNK